MPRRDYRNLLPIAVLLLLAHSRPAVADESCVSVAFRKTVHSLGWQTRTVPLSPGHFQLRAAVDIEGDGRANLVLSGTADTLSFMSVGREGVPLEQILKPPPEFNTNDELARLRAGNRAAELLVSRGQTQLTGLLIGPSAFAGGASSVRNFRAAWGAFAPSPLLDWRCSLNNEFTGAALLGTPDTTAYLACLDLTPPDAVPPLDWRTVASPFNFAGLADLDGDGVEEPLMVDSRGPRWLQVERGRDAKIWASLPPLFRAKRVFVGDFNGDGRSDLFATGDPFRSAFTAISEGGYTVERPDVWPFPESVAPESVVIGDFDGDGADDLAGVNGAASPPELIVAFRRLAEAAPRSGTLMLVRGFEASTPQPVSNWPLTLEALHTGPLGATETICSTVPGIHRLIFLPDDGAPELRTVTLLPERTLHRSFYAKHQSTYGALADLSALPNAPAICLGYSIAPPFFADSKWGLTPQLCPLDFGYFGTSEGERPAERVALSAACCPLPAPDILLPEPVTTYERCPDGYIVTGSTIAAGDCPGCRSAIFCRKVNDARYALGPARPGRYWGNGFSSRGQSEQLQLSDIPLAIQKGIGRTAYTTWDVDGCVGTPIGSLLVKRGGKYCNQFEYRELLYKGLPGDPPAGTPVKMFPECLKLEDMFDPTSGCIPPPESSATPAP